MKFSDAVEIDDPDRRDLFDYVERQGEVPTRDAEQRLFPHDDRAFAHHVAILKRDGYLEERDGHLVVALETEGAEEEHVDDDLAFTIRPARQADLGGIVGAIRQVAGERTYIEAETVAEALDHDEALLRHNDVESRMFFVACVDDEVVGWAHVEAPEFAKLKHNAEITFGVIEDYRGHGIGRHLFQRAIAWAKDQGYEKIYQSVPATNEEGLDFLEELGCEVEAVREDHYKIAGDYVDEVMTAKRL